MIFINNWICVKNIWYLSFHGNNSKVEIDSESERLINRTNYKYISKSSSDINRFKKNKIYKKLKTKGYTTPEMTTSINKIQ